jgi:hypothetical protein
MHHSLHSPTKLLLAGLIHGPWSCCLSLVLADALQWVGCTPVAPCMSALSTSTAQRHSTQHSERYEHVLAGHHSADHSRQQCALDQRCNDCSVVAAGPSRWAAAVDTMMQAATSVPDCTAYVQHRSKGVSLTCNTSCCCCCCWLLAACLRCSGAALPGHQCADSA